jgi:transposase
VRLEVLSLRVHCGWVVERTLGWLSKCRAILVRYDKKAANYLGLIKVASG